MANREGLARRRRNKDITVVEVQSAKNEEKIRTIVRQGSLELLANGQVL